MDRNELMQKIRTATAQSDAFLSLEPNIRTKFLEVVDQLPQEKLEEFLALVENGNQAVGQMKTDLATVKNNEDATKLENEIGDTNQLMKKGQTLSAAIQSQSDKIESDNSADNLLHQLNDSQYP